MSMASRNWPGALIITLFLATIAGPVQGRAQDGQRAHVEAAAARFGLSPDLISEVISAESNGEPKVVSRAGAMGLMQLMPGTWAELRDRLALGDDPFDPRDNILAGAAYLRLLLDRYGAPGFLAAYNAGPGRYEKSLAGRPLPKETRAYVERLASVASGQTRGPRWIEAGLFSSPWSNDLGQLPSSRGVSSRRAGGLFASRGSPEP